MNCHEFDQRIQHLLDVRTSPAGDAQLQAHALGCAACDELLSGYSTLLAGVQQVAVTQPRPGSQFAAQAVARLQADEAVALNASQGPSRLRVWASLATVAALVLLAVGVGTWSNLRQADNGGDVVGENQQGRPPAGVVGIAARGPVEPKASVARPRQFAATSPRQDVSGLSVPAVSRPDDFYGYRISIQSLAMQLPSAVGQIDSVEQYAPSIRPIRESFSTAFETLWRTLPGQPSEQSDQRPQAGARSMAGSLVA